MLSGRLTKVCLRMRGCQNVRLKLNVGNGVILTATWLLTFALVPGTWEDDMFPEVAPPATTGSAPTGSKHREP